MFRFKNYKIAFNLSVLLMTALFVVFVVFYFFSSVKFTFQDVMLGSVLILMFFLFSILLLHLRIERSILRKLKGIYDDLSPSGFSENREAIESDMESLKESLRQFADDKKLEIEVLKDKESYRKEFIGNISHELKTPLFTIQGYVLTLLEGGVNDKDLREKYLKRTAKGVERLVYIVKDLDLITQFESGIKSIERNDFDIIKLVENVFELFEMQANKSEIILSFENTNSQPILVNADEERIQQVLTNLVINSLKYGVNKGTTEISIQDLNEEKVIVRVTDNGEGIEREHLPRLFERFYRVDKSGNRDQGGSGLGLAIVKHIIEAHQEKIFVESSPGVGSEFSFTLQKT